MKVITKDQAVDLRVRKQVAGTAGVYALVDPRSGVPRYVGSTSHAEHRLYSHVCTASKNGTPKERWIVELKAKGLWPELWVLEEFDVGPQQGEARHEAERRWIVVCEELFAGADLNVRLTPVGHEHSKNSAGKKLHAELSALRKKVKELENELAILRGLELQHCNTTATLHRVASCAASKSAMQRNSSLEAVAVLH